LRSARRSLPHIDLIDVARCDPDLDRKRVRIRHDQHDLLAGRDHAANGMDAEFAHASRLRCPDINAIELIDRCGLAFSKIGELRACFDQVLADFCPQILIWSPISAILPFDWAIIPAS
jgi:hypothetical protein